MRASLWISLLSFAASTAGCQSAPAEPAYPLPQASETATSASDISGDAAFAHLRALTRIGPRVAGTPGGSAARAQLRGELERLGLRVEERRFDGAPGPDGAPRELVNLVAVIPGASPDLVVLAAPYDTRRFDQFEFVGANDGASGPALLLELARVIQTHPLHYTTWIVFLDGEAPSGPGADAQPELAGSRALAAELLAAGGTKAVRMLVVFQQVGDADLRVARDLRSHRLFREEFWFAAARTGHQDVFRADDPYESPIGSHLPFIDAGFRGVVLITDPAYGGGEPPGAHANSEDDTEERCSPQSLAAVGAVTLAALDEISQRLAKIDRFAQRPEPAPAAEPAGREAPAPSAPPTPAPAPGVTPAPGPTPAPEAAPAAGATPAPDATALPVGAPSETPTPKAAPAPNPSEAPPALAPPPSAPPAPTPAVPPAQP